MAESLVSSDVEAKVKLRNSEVLLPAGTRRPFAIVTGLFFLWGIPNSLNDVLIRQFMKSLDLNRFQAGLVQSAFFLGYFFLALPAGLLMKHYGYKLGFIVGLLLFSSGCFLFLPAANSGRYGAFLVALFVIASGLAFLESASNPFVAQLGPTVTSERRLNFAQAFNPLGYISGILLGTRFIFSGVELSPSQIAAMQASGTYLAYRHAETMRVVAPYLIIGVLALVWAGMIASLRLPSFMQTRDHDAEVAGNWRELLHKPHFLLAIVAQFLYCGASVCTWSYFIQYAKEYTGTSERVAGVLLACTIGLFGLGRFTSTILMRRFAPVLIMAVYGIVNASLLVVAILSPNRLGLGAITATSFFLSLMFPTIFALGLKDLGPNTKIAGSFIVMAIVGGAVMTPLMGLLAQSLHNTALAYVVPLFGNLGIAAYARYMFGYSSKRMMVSTFEI
ncbi:L-fucose:H+ symporter permease [Edaphobacter flagellatus]|uniref:L-fucose:H+ symporter permease n=1 Tax=Edaphobacter flagellatus TaxID=1933044 RepID=UPI0021B2F30D|nr:L-fucose:H+ symporter permease [Edaphobacter flagellatus]